MGERQSDGGLSGRRRVHPGGPVSGHWATARPHGSVSGRRHVLDDADLEALLAASLIRHRIDAEAEQRAVAAFRAARDAGAHRTHTRRRDDWRPREHHRAGRSVKAAVSVLLASLTLGGVAVAAIGVAGSSTDGGGDDRQRPHATSSAPGRPGDRPSGAGSPSTRPDRPAPAQDTEAHCRAYEQVTAEGKVLEATAWQRLVEAAGGEKKVAAYCAEQLARATAEAKPDKTGSADKGDKSQKGTGDTGGTGGAGSADGTGGAGNGDSGTARNDTGSAGSDVGNTGTGTGSTSGGADSGQGKPPQTNGKNP